MKKLILILSDLVLIIKFIWDDFLLLIIWIFANLSIFSSFLYILNMRIFPYKIFLLSHENNHFRIFLYKLLINLMSLFDPIHEIFYLYVVLHISIHSQNIFSNQLFNFFLILTLMRSFIIQFFHFMVFQWLHW